MSIERQIFTTAREIEREAERAAYLDKACSGNAELRLEVEQLLAIDDEHQTLSFPSDALLQRADFDDRRAFIGTTIGRYKLLEEIGEGGCGVVYMAEQRQPVHRKVALKVIKPGMDTREVIARFEAERQALALMDHPNIARILDGGATPLGRPYFAMELVNGATVTEYCDDNTLATPQRLKLFVDVCRAVQHAHQKGVIHRDIKPSNVLVTLHDGIPVAKVIDFGIAKAIQQPLTEKTLFTQYGRMIGTPQYMSPEQAERSGLDIDTRTDIYSLGVLLYELLTGSTPIDTKQLRGASYEEVLRIIRTQDAPTPSSRLSTLGERAAVISRLRATDRRSLVRTCHGELDWIVMKALEKDRTRRYATANSLADDIQQYLADQPVSAGPLTPAYRLRKFVQRNRALAIGGIAIMAAIATGAIALTIGLVVAIKAGNEAQASELSARQNAYAADMNLAFRALQSFDRVQLLDALDRHRPAPGQVDVRGWEWRYLWQQCQSDAKFVVVQHDNPVFRLAVSHDGKYLAVGLIDGRLEVWDLTSRTRIAPFEHDAPIVAVAFSPQSGLLASASKQGDLKLFEGPAFNRPIASDEAGAPLRSLNFSADGQTLGAFATDGTIRLWNISSMEATRFRAEPKRNATVGAFSGIVCFAPDNGAIGVGDTFGNILLVEPPAKFNGEPPRELAERWSAHDGGVADMQFSPDGNVLASIGSKEIRFWDPKTGIAVPPFELNQGGLDIAFSPDGTQLASAANDGAVRIWDIAQGKLISTLRGHLSEVYSLDFSQDGHTVVSGSKDGAVLAWDVRLSPRERARRILPGKKRYPVFSPDGQTLAVQDADGYVTLVSMDDWTERQLTALGSVALPPWAIRRFPMLFSPDGELLAATSQDGDLRIWDVTAQTLVKSIPADINGICVANFLPKSHSLVTAHRLQESNTEHALRCYEMDSWHLTKLVPEIRLPIVSVDVTRDERFIATTHEDFRVLLWNRNTSAEPHVLGRKFRGRPVHFSPNGQLLAVGGEDGSTKIWHLEDQAETRLRGAGYVQSLSFSNDSRRLAVGGGTLSLWDMTTFRNLGTLETSAESVIAAFSPDGNVLAASDADGSLYIWRAPTWDEIHQSETKVR